VLKARSDIVSVHCGLAEKTKKMFNLAAFKKMKKTAVFVNTSRLVYLLVADVIITGSFSYVGVEWWIKRDYIKP